MNITVLKWIDRTVGKFVVRCMSAAVARTVGKTCLVLLIRPGGIGDAVILIPTIKALREMYPACKIDVLAEKRNADSFSLVSGIRAVYAHDSPVALSLVLKNYDVVIDTEQWYRLSAVVARLVRAPIKIGFGTNERRRMFTYDIPYDPDVYEVDNFLALLKPLGVEGIRESLSVALKLPPESIVKADQLLEPLYSEPFVVILPGSSVPEKCWGKERFSIVARQLGEDGYKVVVVGGKEDRGVGEQIAGTAGLNLAGKTTLPETAAVIARSRLVICGDSGVLHIAAGLGVPTVSLFGPSSEVKWAPRGDNHVVLNRHLPCSPCSRFGTIPPCPINVRCMKEITPDEVLEAARRLLSPPPEQKI